MSEYIFKLPDLGEGTVEAEIAEWMVKVGDTVQEEDTICAMLTDKAAVELTAPVSGTVKKVAGEAGETIPVGSPLVVFETSGEAATAPAAPEAPEESPAPVAAATPQPENKQGEADQKPAGGKVKTSPSIRQRAREANIDLNEITGTGPRGRITKADFEAFTANPDKASGARATPTRSRATGQTEIKVIGLRRKIAQRMQQSSQEIPHFAYVEELDITALESLRQELNGAKSEGDATLTLLPFIGLAMRRSLSSSSRL